MKLIGFKNFRKFEKCFVQLGGISFLVGPNNSGKSTIVKALILLNEYLRSSNIQKFSFAKSAIEDINIVTYGRAKRKGAKPEDDLSFSASVDQFIIYLHINGSTSDTEGIVRGVEFNDTVNKFSLCIDFEQMQVSITPVSTSSIITNPNLKAQLEITRELSVLKKDNTTLEKRTREYIENNAKIEQLERKLKILITNIVDQKNAGELFPDLQTSLEIENDLVTTLKSALFDFSKKATNEFAKSQKGLKTSEDFPELILYKEKKVTIEKSLDSLAKSLTNMKYQYLGSSSNKQAALFLIRNKLNPVSQAIHDYAQLKVMPGEKTHIFIHKWMKEFSIGSDFRITSRAGEAYEFEIIDHEGVGMSLADSGMGTIQIMMLLLRLSVTIETKDEEDRITLAIEEPEINLHPSLQSLLCDLFLEIHNTYNVNFIIETHSEYIIRRSQVIVAKENYGGNLGGNPFSVVYFYKDGDKNIDILNYEEDGTFDKDFGPGFFDEASLSALQLMRLGRKKRKDND